MEYLDLSQLQKKVRRIEIISNRLVNERVAGDYHSVFKGQGIEFEEVRPYVFGDDVRSIDWNVTARAGAPHIKRFREEREMTVFMIVDLSGSSQFGTVSEFKSELMAEISAVLALAAISNNDCVGLMLLTDRVEKVIPPRKGRRHVLRMIRDVLAYQPEGSCTNLALGLDHLRNVLHRKAVVFLISDFQDDGYEQALASVARRHDTIAIAVEDPMESELPDAGLIRMIDSETGSLGIIDTSSSRVRDAFDRQIRDFRETRAQVCRRHEIDLIELSTRQDYDMELVRFFRKRAKRLKSF
jgi:uncharacterized protein (DUF58 family)